MLNALSASTRVVRNASNGLLSLARAYGSEEKSSAHPLQALTDEYLNEPAKHDSSMLSWAPGDPPPESDSSPFGRAALAHTDPLARWVLDQGGYIDPNLYVGTSPTLKCRGVLKKSSFEPPGENGAVLMLPENIEMSMKHARSGLSRVLSDLTIERIQAASDVMLLALYLAIERRKGKHSFWAPYIQSLPKENPCGWAMSQAVQLSVIKQARSKQVPLSKSWVRSATQKRINMINREYKVLGRSLRLSHADIVWAYGMVESRCYTSVDENKNQVPSMVPFLDICNHAVGGTHPGKGRANGVWNICITNTTKEPLSPGPGELLVDYLRNQLTKEQLWLQYGIIQT